MSTHKFLLALSLFLCSHLSATAQSKLWTWVKGDSVINQNGVYGIQGVAAPANKPHARASASTWTDTAGNFWLLGGLWNPQIGATMYVSDLWKFDPTTQEWTWVKGDSTIDQSGVYGIQGTAAAANKPGARASAGTWTDASGRLWLFGGIGFDAMGAFGYLNDLWKFDPGTQEWTWVKGDSIKTQLGIYGMQGIAAATNKPGARCQPATWTDAAGNLWLLGGLGYLPVPTTGEFNDLWKFDVLTQEWTWVKGDSMAFQRGVYGTQGVASVANKPGARTLAAHWTDAAGNFWLLGGRGYPANGAIGYLNDLWKFNPTIQEWTWIKGDSITNQRGSYGTQGTAAIGNKPGGRTSAATAIDGSGNLWLMGGYGYAASGSTDNLNDLWKYEPATQTWTWVKGDSTINGLGTYGTQGTATVANKPGARQTPLSWSDAAGRFWLMGGYGYAAGGSAGFLNDLWRLESIYTWSGNTSTAWTATGNWVGGFVPTATDSALIPATGVTNEPTISTAGISLTRLEVQTGRTLTLSGHSLSLTGDLTNNGTIAGVALTNVLNMNGTTAQTINGIGDIDNLTINNNTSIAAGNTNSLRLKNIVIVNSGKTLTTNGNLVLRSTATNTAIHGASAGTIGGDVTVERFIGIPTAKRAWRFLAPPITTGLVSVSIANNWQNDFDGTPLITTPGVGTCITNPSNTNGSDFQSGDFSLKKFDVTTQTLVGVTNINSETVSHLNPAFLFVRGDRTVTGAGSTNNTTLKTVQTLNSASVSTSLPLNANELRAIGNPYASPIDFNLVSRTALLKLFYAWDPNLGSLGGYVTVEDLDGDNVYTISPSTGTSQTQIIQSGQAFFVEKDGTNGNFGIGFNQACKSTSVTNNVFKTTSADETINTTLYEVDANNNANVIDGTTLLRNTVFLDVVDEMDANKMENFAEGFGIASAGKTLSIERRSTKVNASDVIQFNFTKTQLKNYRINVDVSNYATPYNLYLVDAYNNTATPLNTSGNTDYDFAVTSANGSWDAHRFHLVYSMNNPLAVKDVASKEQTVTLYPNPVEDHQLQLNFTNMDAGTYRLAVINLMGQIISQSEINHTEATTRHSVKLPSTLAAGNYSLRISKSGSSYEQQFLVK